MWHGRKEEGEGDDSKEEIESEIKSSHNENHSLHDYHFDYLLFLLRKKGDRKKKTHLKAAFLGKLHEIDVCIVHFSTSYLASISIRCERMYVF